MAKVYIWMLSVDDGARNTCQFGGLESLPGKSVCQTLANPKRLEIIAHLRDGEKTVTELMEAMQISQANLSQHLGLMRQKGIVVARREGLNIYYRLSNSKIIQACDLMRQVLLENLETGAVLVEAARA